MPCTVTIKPLKANRRSSPRLLGGFCSKPAPLQRRCRLKIHLKIFIRNFLKVS